MEKAEGRWRQRRKVIINLNFSCDKVVIGLGIMDYLTEEDRSGRAGGPGPRFPGTEGERGSGRVQDAQYTKRRSSRGSVPPTWGD